MSTGDIALKFTFDFTVVPIDMAVLNNDLETDDGLQTACLMSLFTDRRVTDDDLPFGQKSLRGWWGDLFPDVDGDQIGSRLWLLDREKRTVETLNRAIEYAEEAHQWMLDDGVAESLSADASYDDNGFLIIAMTITEPGGNRISFRFKTKWQFEADRS